MAKLRIELVKRKAKPALLRCVREDGTETMAETAVGVEHDLAHYAVESALGLSRSFYGLLAAGMRIQDFDVQAATTKIDIPDEARVTEFIVGLLQIERRNGTPYEDFSGELTRAMKRDVPAWFDRDEMDSVRFMLDDLMRRWAATPAGGRLELVFDTGVGTCR